MRTLASYHGTYAPRRRVEVVAFVDDNGDELVDVVMTDPSGSATVRMGRARLPAVHGALLVLGAQLDGSGVLPAAGAKLPADAEFRLPGGYLRASRVDEEADPDDPALGVETTGLHIVVRGADRAVSAELTLDSDECAHLVAGLTAVTAWSSTVPGLPPMWSAVAPDVSGAG